MVIGFVGDVHSRAFHALAALLKWQATQDQPFDLVVQVGDLGVLPNPETREMSYDRFSLSDPSVYDLWHLIQNEDELPPLMAKVRSYLPTPILAVAGNHDEFAPVRDSLGIAPHAPVPLDPHDTFAGVPDGFTVQIGDETVGFCEGSNIGVFEKDGSPRLDVLVTHEGGFDVEAEKDELAVGSDALLEYLQARKPRYHVFGHFHHPVGPRMVHEAPCVQLASVVSHPLSDKPVMEAGGFGALDTETDRFEFLDDAWLGDFTRVNGYEMLCAAIEELGG